MATMKCKKCRSLLIVPKGSEMMTCRFCGTIQPVPLPPKSVPVDSAAVQKKRRYELLIYNARTYKDLKVLTETAEELDSLGDYEKSREMAEFCRGRIAEEQRLQAEAVQIQQANEQQLKHNRSKHRLRVALTVIAIVGAILSLPMATKSLFIPTYQYIKANVLMTAGDYERANVILKELDGFANSEALLEKCEVGKTESRYQGAVAAMESGNYSSARRTFNILNGYKDSADLALECSYQNGRQLMEEGKYDQALNEFEAILDYKDAADLADEAKSKLEAAG